MPHNASHNNTVFMQHYDHPACIRGICHAVQTMFSELNHNRSREIIYLCIGTDRATGDCLGPLVGTRLKSLLPSAHIFGCLEEPLHALNLTDVIKSIYSKHDNPLIVAVDASLGAHDKVGFLGIKKGALAPGLALKKQLPRVGDIHIVGIVNVSGFCEHLVLQNTRLFVVQKMAEAVSRALFLAHPKHTSSAAVQSMASGKKSTAAPW